MLSPLFGVLQYIRLREALLGGSWIVISGVISPLIWVISIVTLLITLLITTHEPPCTASCFIQIRAFGVVSTVGFFAQGFPQP